MEKKPFLESDSMGIAKFQGRLEKKSKYSMSRVCLPVFAYFSLALTLWELPVESQSLLIIEKISRIQVLKEAFYQTTVRLKIRGLLFYK